MTMEKIKLIFVGAILSVIAILSGCAKEEASTTPVDNTVVNLRLDEALMEKAYVRLTHNGASGDFWYYMITTDLESDAAALLNGYIASILESEGELLGNVGVNKNITFTDLSARTDYRVIASRISETGELIGNVAELCFVTKRDPSVFELYDAWEITYKERKLVTDPYSETEVFECKVTDEKSQETYIPCLLSKEDFKNAYGNNHRKCFEDYIDYRNQLNVKWVNEVTAETSEFLQDRLRHGDYIVFMIGVDANGELTGYYAQKNCTIAQETATTAYRRWLGDWKLSGTYNGVNVSYEVEISPDENNMYYRMYGWESLTALDYFANIPDDLPILLYFDKVTGDAYVISEALPDFSDNAALADFYDFYLFGAISYNGTTTVVDIPNLRLARLTLVDDNHANAYPENFIYDNGSEVIETPFLYFCYIYTDALTSYMSYIPVTTDMKVPAIANMRLERL